MTDKLAHVGAALLLETLDSLAAGTCLRIPQDDSKASYAPAITPEDSVIHWDEPAQRIRDRIRALSPKPGAFASMNGRRIKFWAAQTRPSRGEGAEEAEPAQIVAVTRGMVDVGTGQGILSVMEVQPEGSRRMSAPDWARGARLRTGDRFESK